MFRKKCIPLKTQRRPTITCGQHFLVVTVKLPLASEHRHGIKATLGCAIHVNGSGIPGAIENGIGGGACKGGGEGNNNSRVRKCLTGQDLILGIEEGGELERKPGRICILYRLTTDIVCQTRDFDTQHPSVKRIGVGSQGKGCWPRENSAINCETRTVTWTKTSSKTGIEASDGATLVGATTAQGIELIT